MGLLNADRRALLRVLVVDDSAEFRSAVRAYLHGATDAQVVGEACDGDQATREVERLQPSLVLMDIHMPGCNGLEAARRMRKLERRPHIVLFSLHPEPELQSAALAAGADEFYYKRDFVPLVEATLAKLAGG
jgi:two-component system, NarL family, response regulator DesR